MWNEGSFVLAIGDGQPEGPSQPIRSLGTFWCGSIIPLILTLCKVEACGKALDAVEGNLTNSTSPHNLIGPHEVAESELKGTLQAAYICDMRRGSPENLMA